jgi:hypothetical protein
MFDAPVVLDLPFEGPWLTQNSPARRVPSHGSDLFGESYAIDFVAVDERRRTATRRDWRTVLATEPPERFLGFGRPILAPADGVVVAVHDGEPDHEARRSQLALVPYALSQASRARAGLAAVAGNHVVIELAAGTYVALVHLKESSVCVDVGDTVVSGQPIGACGNSGNSTQPHLHLQAMDSTDLSVARGLPIVFRSFLQWSRGAREPERVTHAVPVERAVVAPC